MSDEKKKRFRIYYAAAAVVVLAGAGLLAFYTVPAFHMLLHPHAAGDNAATTADKYTCGMHPFVISDKPGNCPVCGMTLTKIESAPAPAGTAAAPPAPAASPGNRAEDPLLSQPDGPQW